jgi:putative ABC transport system substrate-binding protein
MRRRKFSILLGGALMASTARRFAAHAQQKATPVIGYLYGGVAGYSSPDVAAFRRGLDETGYVEDQTWRSNTDGRTVTMIDCPAAPPTLSAAR